ncbi:peroxisomal ABC transporter 1 [Actinidia rufa]|uniref:Peroxisomal ABC transporter 1 n=1 Tax=Actinidia rufa TaxID=165716 RepID=A0A7J0H6S3_9ERIC|nr:peroxisomal ABC transporter 1 [Actinidia rufa]
MPSVITQLNAEEEKVLWLPNIQELRLLRLGAKLDEVWERQNPTWQYCMMWGWRITNGIRSCANRKSGESSTQELHKDVFGFRVEVILLQFASVSLISCSGALCVKQMVESRFQELLDHSKLLLKRKWVFGVLDDFITKQLPHNVTWALSLLYAMEHKGDRALTSTQGELAHALRFLASVVSQSFMAFGDILELNRKYLELSGGINRIFELEELLDVAQKGWFFSKISSILLHTNVHLSADNPVNVIPSVQY